MSILFDVPRDSQLTGSLSARLVEIATKTPEAVLAMDPDGNEVRAAPLLAEATRIAEQLPQGGKRIVLRAPNILETLAALYGIWLSGDSAVLVSPMTPESELERRTEVTGASAVVEPRPQHDPVVTLVSGGTNQVGEAAIIFTSGTTGLPKAASISAKSLIASTEAVVTGLGFAREGRAMVVPARAPQLDFVSLAHMGGLLATQTSWGVGKPMLLVQKFDADLTFDLVERFSIPSLALTPTMVYDLAYASGDRQLSSVKSVAVGTAALPESTRIAFEERYGVPILRNYGQTEVAGAIAFERLDDVRAGRRPPLSVGRLAPGIEVRLVGAEGHDVAPGEVGEIWARGRSTMTGYLDGNRDVAPRGPSDGWVVTGDLGTLDSDGFMTVVGRVRDVLICGGFNVYPAVVEAAINELPGVMDSAVAGIEDERLGDIPVAVVVVEPQAEIELESLRTALRTRLAGYELPRQLLIVDEIPRTDNGKVVRRQVAALFK